MKFRVLHCPLQRADDCTQGLRLTMRRLEGIDWACGVAGFWFLVLGLRGELDRERYLAQRPKTRDLLVLNILMQQLQFIALLTELNTQEITNREHADPTVAVKHSQRR